MNYFSLFTTSRNALGAALVAGLVIAGASFGTSSVALACPEHAHEEPTKTAAPVSKDGIEIVKPWSRATATAAKVAGGYLVIRNTSDADDVLVSGSTDISDRFEVHEMAVTDGVMRMRKLEDGLVIKAGGSVELKPGSFHVMFMGLKRQLREGETFNVDLVFRKAGTVPVTFTVQAIGARDGDKAKTGDKAADHHDHGHNHGHDHDHGDHGKNGAEKH